MAYWGTGRNRFQLEVPIAALTGHSIPEYELSSQKKGFRRYVLPLDDQIHFIPAIRYRTPAIEEMLKRLTAAEERRDKALRDVMEELFHSFDQQ